ncbi:TetR/AcrR family transcriptional regulator [Ralstonia solanacearum]|uniref:TetR family transcriptional regulator n=1 Tax=Ralstonia solanacearum K60 TaxID=1091042 RepID=A0AAP7ZLH2_RALSL|nr:TetR/AcrR family transcriptional regulator [Ralstonia solanacearum]MBT1537237.1 TetR/AcrR family transcriptional regulator [Ralstonia solanacearum]OYQ12792.1 TetR family transcriptional regulator [Ralstonia solanacearum K60]QOK83136.1 TetR/AcrR family transcriptional regulator [Ralstonia solanacearum]RIJ87536.1 TetR/AcrR family transcriptional regulator [Ralstonia solanacearum]
MGRPGAGDTKSRILEATELLFIEFGYEAMSLRQITARAKVNLAAVNYHFGSKEALMQSVLGRRLDPLNTRRQALLTACEARWPQHLSCEHVLGALFVPALQMARNPDTGGPAFLRLMGRVYSDPSSFVQGYLLGHYAPVFDRFFEALARALPGLPRAELGWRLHFSLKALAGGLAGDDINNLLPMFTQGKPMTDATLLARLTALVVATLNAPLPADEAGALDQVIELAEAQHPSSTAPAGDDPGGNGGNGGAGRPTGHGGAEHDTERAGSTTAAAPFSGDPFGRTPVPRAGAEAAPDATDEAGDTLDDGDTAPRIAPSARTRALAIRRSNAARAIFPANPMRPWRSPNA